MLTSDKKQKIMANFNETNPTVSKVEMEQRGVRMPSHAMVETLLHRFFESNAFQQYCNLADNKVDKGKIIRVVTDNFNLIPMVGINGLLELEDEFHYAIVPDGYEKFLYKSNKVLTGRKVCGERQIGLSQSYLVSKEGDKWTAKLLLKNGKEVKQDYVKTAFEDICRAKGYRISQSPSIYKVAWKGTETFAWVSVVFPSTGGGRILACLVDNGEILDVPTDAIEMKPFDGRRVETRYNRFQWTGEELVR